MAGPHSPQLVHQVLQPTPITMVLRYGDRPRRTKDLTPTCISPRVRLQTGPAADSSNKPYGREPVTAQVAVIGSRRVIPMVGKEKTSSHIIGPTIVPMEAAITSTKLLASHRRSAVGNRSKSLTSETISGMSTTISPCKRIRMDITASRPTTKRTVNICPRVPKRRHPVVHWPVHTPPAWSTIPSAEHGPRLGGREPAWPATPRLVSGGSPPIKKLMMHKAKEGPTMKLSKRSLTAILGGAAIVVSGGALAYAQSTPRAASVATAPPTYVTAIARMMAARMGDAQPTSAMYVATTRVAAESLVAGATHFHANPNVFFVVLHGQFKDTYARIPPGTAIPTGTEIDFTIDPVTHTVLDFGISNQNPDLSRLGVPHGVPFGAP